MNRNKDFHYRNDYNNVDVTSINRMLSRSPMNAYGTMDEAKKAGESGYKICLDGEYDFAVYDNPDMVEEFYRTDYDVKSMKKITVPGNWETQGFGKPVYTNNIYPWDLSTEEKCSIKPGKDCKKVPNPPFIPEFNPTGCYRNTFVLPKSFENRRTSIRFDGVETAYYLWINGEPVGYSEDSKLPSEFDITDFVKAGENLMALQVMSLSDSTYLEDQDYWYLCGIFRSVWLISKPKISIEDYKIIAEPNLHHLTGKVSCDVTVTRETGFADYSVGLTVFDGDKKIGETTAKIMPSAQYRTDKVPTANTARAELDLNSIELWNTENPKLYRAVVTLFDGGGKAVDFESTKIGFKKVEIIGGILYLNGERLIVRGVNRHEHFPQGRTVPREHMVEEIRQMKRMNINSVRTCHYPDSPVWYELCDELGILLICECNLETHGVMGGITHNPLYVKSFVERASRMVLTYKNHVSIYSWSLGNESGTGANHAAMYGFVKEYDKTRICQYEAGQPSKNISDIRGDMYAPIKNIMGLLTDTQDDRPIILVEYLYQISNSGGGAYKFKELLEDYRRFQGGYVWDWQDKCLANTTADGTKYFAHGGDFGERFVENECPVYMTNNGLVTPDLRWKPVAKEIKEVYSPIWIEKLEKDYSKAWPKIPEADEYILRNRSGISSGEFKCTAFLKEDGRIISEKSVELPKTEGYSDAVFFFNIPHKIKDGCEYNIDISIVRAKKQWYCEKDYEVFSAQFNLPGGGFKPVALRPNDRPKLIESKDELLLTGKTFAIKISKNSGEIISAVKNKVKYITNSVKPVFTRPRTGLDTMPGWGVYSEHDFANTLEKKVLSCEVSEGNNFIRAEFTYVMLNGEQAEINGKLAYKIYSDGAVEVSQNVNVGGDIFTLSRVGTLLEVREGFENLEYFAYGGNECYSDRMESAKLGVYRTTVELEHFPFLPPSENGGHEGARYLMLSDNSGNSLKITGKTLFHFDVKHNKTEDYAVTHEHELIKRKEVYVNIDAAHGQIGSDMGWSTGMDKELILGKGTYFQSYIIEMM